MTTRDCPGLGNTPITECSHSKTSALARANGEVLEEITTRLGLELMTLTFSSLARNQVLLCSDSGPVAGTHLLSQRESSLVLEAMK